MFVVHTNKVGGIIGMEYIGS